MCFGHYLLDRVVQMWWLVPGARVLGRGGGSGVHAVLPFFLIMFLKIYLFVIFCLCWVFVAALRLSLVAASGGYSSL